MSVLLPELERQLRAAVRGRARRAERDSRARVRLRRTRVAAGATLVAAASAIVLAAGLVGGGAPSAAQALERAAQAAQRGLAAPSLAPGEYWYTSSIVASTTGVNIYGGPALIQWREYGETWVGTDGSGRERRRSGEPRFFGAPGEFGRFLRRQERAPKPVPHDSVLPSSEGLRSPLGLLSYKQVLELPADPAGMLVRIRGAAVSSREQARRTAPGSPLAEESLTQLELETSAGVLEDLPLTPGSRAAVYRAMKDIGGVSYLPRVRDWFGREGAALANQESIAFIDATGALAGRHRVTNELIFDPRTGVLIAQQRVLDQPIAAIGLRAGYPVQYTVYVVSGSVASTHERFAPGRKGEVTVPAPSGASCSSVGPAPARLISAPIPSAFLDRFAVLRRAPQSQDRLPRSTTSGQLSLPLDVSSIFQNSVHLVQTTSTGARDYLFVGYCRAAPALPPLRCLPGLSRAQYQREVQRRAAALKAPPQAVICVLESGGNHGFPCLTPAEVDSIDYETSDYGRPPATVTGLIPDGVSEIRAIYPRGRAIIARVAHNLLAYRVGLSAPSAAPMSVVWLAPDGHVVRRFVRP